MISKNMKEFSDILFDSWIGYIYLFDEKNNQWLWDNYSYDKSELTLFPLNIYFDKNYKVEVQNISLDEVKELANDNFEYLVFQGCGGNLNDWVNGVTNMLKDEKIVSDSFSFDKVYSFENGNLTNLAFALNSSDIDMGKLSIFRLKIRDDFKAMWLSDYVDNYTEDINI